MSYRPVTDVWILARAKLKPDEDGNKQGYYGAFPSGFLHRARALLGVRHTDPVLHVCAGMVKDYRFRGFGPNDLTLDINPALSPDFLMDARRLGVAKGDLFPSQKYVFGASVSVQPRVNEMTAGQSAPGGLWPAILIDRPYTEEDHAQYAASADVFPADLNDLLRRALECVEPGGRVGVLDYLWPSPPTKLGREVAVIAVGTGRNNRARWFTVFERLIPGAGDEATDADVLGQVVESPAGGTIAIEGEGERQAAVTPPPDVDAPSPSPVKRRRGGVASASVADSAAPTELQRMADEGARRMAPLVAGLLCVACGGTRQNSKGADCVCVRRLTGEERAAVLAAVASNVCHGCREGFMLEGEGMERIEPLTDQPNPWHRACWTQKQQRDAEATQKATQERAAREAQEKGWPICGGCAKPIQPAQKNINGRHTACGKAPPPVESAAMARRRRAAALPWEGGF